VHASLLPRWRGAAPIQRAIEAGDRESGVALMQMDEGLDSGPVLMQRALALSPDETSGSLHDALAAMGAELLLAGLQALLREGPESAELEPQSQDERFVTYARKLSKAEARIDWSEPADVIERRVRAFNPWPVCWFDLGGERVRLWRAMVIEPGDARPAGTVLAHSAEGIDIATGSGALRLLELQPAGGRRMEARDFLNARRFPDRL
jgi:methionyl-tRNA formyltransferase